MAEYSEFRVDSAKITEAKTAFEELGKKYAEVAASVESSLNTIGATAWPDGGPAKEMFDSRAAVIKTKLAAIQTKFETNKKVFDAVETYATQFESKMATHISAM